MSNPERYSRQELSNRLFGHQIEIHLDKGSKLVLGREDLGITDADILQFLKKAGVSSKHFVLEASAQGILLRPLTLEEADGKLKANLYFNESKVGTKGVRLMSGNTLRIRDLQFRITVKEDNQTVALDRFTLVQSAGTEKLVLSRDISLPQDQGIVVIGRQFVQQRGLSTEGVADTHLKILAAVEPEIEFIRYELAPEGDVSVLVLRKGKERTVTAQDYFELQDKDQVQIGKHFYTVDLDRGILEYTASL